MTDDAAAPAAPRGHLRRIAAGCGLNPIQKETEYETE